MLKKRFGKTAYLKYVNIEKSDGTMSETHSWVVFSDEENKTGCIRKNNHKTPKEATSELISRHYQPDYSGAYVMRHPSLPPGYKMVTVPFYKF